jgi:hypothetical protein
MVTIILTPTITRMITPMIMATIMGVTITRIRNEGDGTMSISSAWISGLLSLPALALIVRQVAAGTNRVQRTAVPELRLYDPDNLLGTAESSVVLREGVKTLAIADRLIAEREQTILKLETRLRELTQPDDTMPVSVRIPDVILNHRPWRVAG